MKKECFYVGYESPDMVKFTSLQNAVLCQSDPDVNPGEFEEEEFGRLELEP